MRDDAPCTMRFDFKISAYIPDQIPVLDCGGLPGRRRRIA